MVYHEGILVTSNEVVNAAAIGADIEASKIRCMIYRPSDTARNLESEKRFTYCLTDDPLLFFKGALTGNDEPKSPELSEEELCLQDDFFYPKKATKVYFCTVDSTFEKYIFDEYGEARLKGVEGTIICENKIREAQPLDREDPLVDAMVHATRLSIADEEKKESLQGKIREILAAEESTKNHRKDVKDKIIEFVEGAFS